MPKKKDSSSLGVYEPGRLDDPDIADLPEDFTLFPPGEGNSSFDLDPFVPAPPHGLEEGFLPGVDM